MRFQDGVGETTCLSQKEECNRMYTLHYDSPLGGILLAADEVGLTGLWFEGEKYFANILGPEQQERETPALQMAKRWLDVYFSGREPGFYPAAPPVGSPFRRRVGAAAPDPYGQTTTYGALAQQLAAKQGKTRMSAQAVGGAVGHNEISIIIPCHRVVGSSGSLTGYAGGLDKKIALLKLERADSAKGTNFINIPGVHRVGCCV